MPVLESHGLLRHVPWKKSDVKRKVLVSGWDFYFFGWVKEVKVVWGGLSQSNNKAFGTPAAQIFIP